MVYEKKNQITTVGMNILFTRDNYVSSEFIKELPKFHNTLAA